MDSIDRIMERGESLGEGSKFAGQTWRDFERKATYKKVILFGASVGLDFFYARYGDKLNVVGVVDSDKNLCGCPIKSLALNVPDNVQELKVCAIDFLDNFDNDEIVVLITALKKYEEIAAQLEKMGVNNVFALSPMEISYRLQHGIRDLPDYRQNFCDDCRKLPINNKRVILLTSRDGEGHGKEISARLLKLCPDLDVIWFVRDKAVSLPKGVKGLYPKNSLERIEAMATAKVWLSDTGIDATIKREGQFNLEMKHWSSITLKMFGYVEVKWRGEEVLPNSPVHGWDGIDYALVGSKFDEETCRSGFRFNGPVVYAGSPRTDALFRNHEEIILDKFPNLRGKKRLLYAPTYRIVDYKQHINTHGHNLDFELTKKALEKRFGGDWVILMRLHPFVKNMSHDIKIPPYVIDVSDYYDGEELVAISDALITDYSSIMFEPAFIKRPVFLFAHDKAEYLKKERGFLIDYNTLPFPIAETNDNLVKIIEEFDDDKYKRDIDTFLEKYGVYEDGKAGERAARFIIDLLNDNVHKGEPRDNLDYRIVYN